MPSSGLGASSSPPESSSSFTFANPGPAPGLGASSSPPQSSPASLFAIPPPPAAVFGASSTPFGTSIRSTPEVVPPTTSFGNASPAFSASLVPNSSTASGASSFPCGTSTWSTPGFVPAVAAYGNTPSAFVAAVAPSAYLLIPHIWSTPGFIPPATSFGNVSSAFGASLVPNSSKPGFGTEASSFGTSPSSFGASDRSRIACHANIPEDVNEHQKIVSLCAMKIHSNKSHEELRAVDYQKENKGFGTLSSPPKSSPSSLFPTPAPGAFGASSSPFGTSKSFTPGCVTSATSGNATSAFGTSVAPSSAVCGASSTPFGTSIWSTPGFVPQATSFGNTSSAFVASVAPSSGMVGVSSSPCGTSIWSTPEFVPPATSIGNVSSSFGASVAPNCSKPGFGTEASSFGISTSSFGASATPSSDVFIASSSPFGTSKSSTPGCVTPAAFGNATSAFGASVAPNSGTVFGASSTTFGTSISSTSEFVPPATSFGNASSTFGASVTSSSSTAFGASSLPCGTSTWSTPKFVPPAATFGTSSAFVASATPSSGTVGTSSSPFGTSIWSTPGFVPSTTSFGNTSSAFSSSVAPNSSKPGFGTESSSFGISTSSFGASATPTSDGNRITRYPNIPEDFNEHQMIVSLCAMKIYSNKSHEELRAVDYQLGDKGGLGHASISRGSIGTACTQQNCFSFPVATTNTSSHPDHPAFLIPYLPQPYSAPWMKCLDERGFFYSQPSVVMANMFPCFADHRISSTSNLFLSQTKRDDAKIEFPETPFPLIRPYDGMLFRNKGSRLTAYTETLDNTGKIQSISAMPNYGNKSHEELKLEDYHLWDKGGCKEFLTAINLNPLGFWASPSTPLSFVSSEPSSFKPFPFASFTSSPGISSGTTSFLASTDSQPLQPSQLLAPLGRVPITSPFIGSESTAITVPQNISSSATPTTVPQTVTLTLEQQSVIANPSEALNMAQTSIRHPGTISSIQYGISSRPVTDHPSSARLTSSSRVLSIRRNRRQAEKCKAKSDAPKVAFFTEEARNCGTFKADSSIISRNNPGCWISSPSKEPRKNDSPSEDRTSGSVEEVDNLHGHNENLEMLLPKLVAADYYTEPSISELAAKEKAEPGFCSRVKDFVVGRVGYGSIKFLNETDVRKLELDSIIKFNHSELLVYFNESMEKPPVGQGLNKPAEATLLGVKCIGTKSGNQYIDGPKVDALRERLMKKAAEHGAEFTSYNPVLGEWKFRVRHF